MCNNRFHVPIQYFYGGCIHRVIGDFHLCTRHDVFPFVLRVEQDELGFFSRRIDL